MLTKIAHSNSSEVLDNHLNKNSYSKIFFLVDTNTSEHCLPIIAKNLLDVKYDIIEIDAGEESKNIDICIGIWRMLLDFGADRNSLLLNLGGGMVCDIGGFCASTFMRGISFINIPTSLLAQVDASVGGKTGIDLEDKKNLIGTFQSAEMVIIDPIFLHTLPAREMKAGLAEMIKHGLIYSEKHYSDLTKIIRKGGILNDKLIKQSISIKQQIVKTDPKEKGIRKILNFGHTIGHAIESLSLKKDKYPLLHGEAIAMGIVCESYLSHKYNKLSESDFNQITELILSIFDMYPLSKKNFPYLLDTMKADKKNNNGDFNFSLLSKIGSADFDVKIRLNQIEECLCWYQNLKKKNYPQNNPSF